MTEEADKIIRNPDTLLIKVTPEEIGYREKYLPDPKKLTNEKLVCTVCSKSLMSDVHKGEELFIHRFLQVLTCEACYNFYGDGCFSSDEDGDDKYCRWCGQGGSLFLCSSCTCAFCQKCVKQNLKTSVIAELDNDDWKCYICNPRPLFGTRTICWGAQALNEIGKEKEIDRLRKLKERQDKINERKSRKDLGSGESSKTKRKKASDDDDTSPEVLPSKRSRRDRRSDNGSIGKRETRMNTVSSNDDNYDQKNKRTSSSKNYKSVSYVESSSEDDSDFKNKTRKRVQNKKVRESSSERGRNKSRLNKVSKKSTDASSDESEYKNRTKKNRSSKRQDKYSSDDSSEEKSVKKKNKVTDTKDSSDDEISNKKLKKVESKRKGVTSEKEDSIYDNKKERNKKPLLKKEKVSSSDGEREKTKNKKINVDDTTTSCNNTISAEDLIVRKRINLAILWLSNTIKDISELGSLISVRAKKFGSKRVNSDSLKTYEDVINTVKKLKQLISGVHSNYEHIEKNLDAQLKPWKVLIGKDYVDSEIRSQESDKVIDCSQTNKDTFPESNEEVSVSGANISHDKVLEHESEKEDTNQPPKNNENFSLSYIGDSGGESDNIENNDSKELVSKALDIMEGLETTDKCNKVSSEPKLNNLEENVANENEENVANEKSNTSLFVQLMNENNESSNVLASDSDGEGSLKTFPNNKEIIYQSTPKKNDKDGEPDSNMKSVEIVIKKSDSESDEDVSQKEITNEETGNKSMEKKARKGKKGGKEPLGKKNESTGSKKDINRNRTLSSSDDSASLHLFSKKLKNKWKGELKLKTEQTSMSSTGIKERDAISSEEKQRKKEKDKQIVTINKGNISINKDKNSSKSIKIDGLSKNTEAQDDSSEISVAEGDIIEETQIESDKIDCKGKNNKEKLIVKNDKQHNVESVEIKKKESLKEETKFKSFGLSSDDEDILALDIKSEKNSDDEIKKSKEKEKVLKKKSVHNLRRPNSSQLLDSSEDEEEDVPKNEKKKEVVLIESSDEDIKGKVKKDLKDDSATFSSADSSDSEVFVSKKKQKKKNPNSSESDALETLKVKNIKKRKLVRCTNSSDESAGSGKNNAEKKSSQGESPGKGGRKNIKKIKKGDDLADATKEAAEEEKERRRRIEDRQKQFNQVFEIKETETVKNLVLDFDLENKNELVSVNKDLVGKMKPHQAKGVKFMWDSCFESLSELKKSKGSGCILAHCMGLGKTFQVVSLLHTLLLHEETKVRTVIVVCPLSTVLNWFNEFEKWLKDVEGGDSIDVYHLTRSKQNADRAKELRHWHNTGGVLIIGYEMFRGLSCEGTKKFRPKMRKDFQETLVDPGADIIVCDEGHMLKNEATALSKAMSRVKTLRRIVLTGTPMQNNLKEYHCMVQFVKPNLLGSRKEFLNRFVNPITNGQFVDSTERDVKIMKRRAHVLHKMLEGLVQRFDYNVLTPFLPPKHEYVISVCLSELQVKLYRHYLDNYSQQSDNNKAGSRLFQDWQALGRIWTHPRAIKMSADKQSARKLMEDESDEEGSLKDFIAHEDDDSDKSTTNSSDGSSSGQSIKSDKKTKGRVNRSNRTTRSSNRIKDQLLESSEDENKNDVQEDTIETCNKGEWWSGMIEQEHLDDINHSGKLCLLLAILKECETIEDKVLVFSQSLFSLDLIEYFLDKIDSATQEDRLDERLRNHQGAWSKGLDYFRLDGSTTSENRNIWCKAFNREDNPRARLFLISTRAGGLGINLTAANRVIIFDASWNPSHDVQSIFRVYRFGQKKPCYVYRFIAYGTMEEKVYDRQVAKQSMSNRVVDEQQVHRHFSSNDLTELYSFTPPSKIEDRPIPVLPKDVMLAEILTQFKEWIEKYHEHDSLLENIEAEELNEEERKLAWEDFENDKKRSLMPTNTGTVNNALGAQIEILRTNLKAQYPDKSDAELQPLLVSQVTVLMRQQQQRHWQEQQRIMAAQAQAMANTGNSLNPQMFSSANLSQEQMFNLQVLQMQQQQQHYANLDRSKLHMTQTHQRVPHSFLGNQGPVQSHLSQLLTSQLNNAGKKVQLPKLNINPNTALEMENMRQKYYAARQKPVVITELPNDPKPSTS